MQHYLPLEPWETRVLHLVPAAKAEDELVAELCTAVIIHEPGIGIKSIHKNVEYEALSYTWGASFLTHSISCDGRSIAITRNLSEALH